jgi:hypothetical protein
VPQPDRGGEVLEADDGASEAVGLGGIVGGPELQEYLVLLAEVQGLKVLAAAQVPHVHLVAVAALHQDLGV